jgi:hypothetical protein
MAHIIKEYPVPPDPDLRLKGESNKAFAQRLKSQGKSEWYITYYVRHDQEEQLAYIISEIEKTMKEGGYKAANKRLCDMCSEVGKPWETWKDVCPKRNDRHVMMGLGTGIVIHSKSIPLTGPTTGEGMFEVYMYGGPKGLKTITIFKEITLEHS